MRSIPRPLQHKTHNHRHGVCRYKLPVVSKEDVIPLIMESCHLSSRELGVMWEEGGEHAAYGVPETCGEVVQDDLRFVLCGLFSFSLQVTRT